MSKKVLSVLLAVAMLVTMLCVAGVSAGASDAKQMEGGTIYFEVQICCLCPYLGKRR